MLHIPERQSGVMGLTPDTWRVIGYVRDIVIILGIMFGAMYFYEHPDKFDAFMNWLIGYRYRHLAFRPRSGAGGSAVSLPPCARIIAATDPRF
jgi:hypothetical protein